jgi:hypothetical protein
MPDKVTLETRVFVLETVVASIAEDVKDMSIVLRDNSDNMSANIEKLSDNMSTSIEKLSEKIIVAQKTPWPIIIGFGALFLTVVGFGASIYATDQHRTQEQIDSLRSDLFQVQVESAKD